MQNIINLKSHPWFGCLNWQDLENRQIKPPFVPFVHGENDVSNFAAEFTTCSLESNTSSYSDYKKF